MFQAPDIAVVRLSSVASRQDSASLLSTSATTTRTVSIARTNRTSCAVSGFCVYHLLPVLRNHQGRRGTTADIGDNLLPYLTVFGCSLTAVEVETGPLSDVVFPSFFAFLSEYTKCCCFIA